MSSSNQKRENIATYYGDIEMPGGYKHNLPDRLTRNELYYRSEFKSGKYDRFGNRKFFYQIIRPACDIARKFIDFDTKDINLIPVPSGIEHIVNVMKVDLRNYMKTQKWGQLIDDSGEQLIYNGHFVEKKHRGGWSLVSLLNLRLDPGTKSIDDSDFVYEVHSMSLSQMRAEGFENVDQVEQRGKESQYVVYECYDKTPTGYDRTFVTDLYTKKQGNELVRTPESQINNDEGFEAEIILKSDTVKKLPYREHKLVNVPGRWLGNGFAEYLEDNQIAINEVENLDRQALSYKALQLWQSQDDALAGKNVNQHFRNGAILTSQGSITPIQKDNTDQTAFNNSRARWDASTFNKTHSQDVARGANLPSRTPLGVVEAQLGTIGAFYDIIRDGFAGFYKNLIFEEIIPSFKEEKRPAHQVVFSASDAETENFKRAVVDAKLLKFKADFVLKNKGRLPTDEETGKATEKIQKSIDSSGYIYADIPDGAYDHVEALVDVVITGESNAVGLQQQTIQLAMQMLNNNPNITTNPGTRTLFFKLLNLGGISPTDIAQLQQAPVTPQDVQSLQQGGSVSAETNLTLQPSETVV